MNERREENMKKRKRLKVDFFQVIMIMATIILAKEVGEWVLHWICK